MECPICYDPIEQTRNCITTECGHQFHAACLMKNACINGFSCPSCRAKMVEQEPEDVTESEDDSSHLYLGDMWDDDRVRREEEAQQLDEEHRELSDEEQHQLWEEQHLRREAEFVRSEEEAFERAEEELLRIRGERRRYAELERQREQIEIQNDLIESLYEYQQGEQVDENYYDNGNDQQNGEAPSIEYISEQLVARGVTIDNFVSATLRTNSAYYRSTAEHDRINAVITKHISEIVFEYILRPQYMAAAANA
jgi:hypothetical protein